MSKGINVRFTIPEGSPLERHLASYTSSRARNYELVRLATNALEFGTHVFTHCSHDLGEHKTSYSSPLDQFEPGKPNIAEAKENKEVGYAGIDLLNIG